MPIHDEVLKFSKQAAIFNLLESGVDVNFLEPMLELLRGAVVTGAQFDDLVAELEIFITGDKTRLGTLDRYTKQVVTDTINQFNAEYSTVLADEVGFEFFLYEGSLIQDSRMFCVARADSYYHREEVQGWVKSSGEPKPSGQWQGMIVGTTESSIFINRGGWNCRHQIIGVALEFVPKKDLQRNIQNGNFTPTPSQIEDLNLAA